LSSFDAAAKDLVERRGPACVATVRADGTPSLAPLGHLAVWENDTLVFPDSDVPGIAPDLLLQPAISILVQDGKQRHGRRFRGTARLLLSGPTFDRLLQYYRRRGVKGAVGHMVLVDVEDVSPTNGSA
jgi:hypothetical protein